MKAGRKLLEAAAATATAATAAAVLYEQDGITSFRAVLRELPAGIAGMLQPRPATRISSLERVCREQSTGLQVVLCGTNHADPASIAAVRESVRRWAARRGGLAAVALEPDMLNLAVCGAAVRALRGLPPEAVQSGEGENLVRRALLNEPAVISQATAAGVELRSPEQVPLPSALRLYLRSGGPLWGAEMAEGAEVAAELGIRVVPLGIPAMPRAQWTPVADLACWLRARALCPGLDEDSCSSKHQEAMLRAARELGCTGRPCSPARTLEALDAYLAERIRALCSELVMTGGHVGAARQGAGARTAGKLGHRLKTTVNQGELARVPGDEACLLVLVGAAHVPGLISLLTH